MTPPTPAPAPKRGIHWIWLVVALAVGVFIGYVLFYKGPPGLTGTCTKPAPDTTIVGRGMTQQECKNVCPECTWTQGN
jgi:hypothetical protein